MERVTVFRDLYKSSDVPYHLTISQSLERIKVGKSKDIILKIRNAETKEIADTYKKKLPCILFSGRFTQRSKEGLKSHSGFIVFDLDDLSDLEATREELKEIPYVLSIFTSPSGNGLKFIVRIPKCDAKEHSQYFRQFEKEYDYLDIDPSGKDIARVCFESYDPDLFINEKAIIYNPELIEEGFSNFEKVPVLPINDETEIIKRILNFNWSKSPQEGERNSFIFDLSSMFCEYGVSEHSAMQTCLSYRDKGFDDREIENTVKSAYKRRQFGIKYFEDYDRIKSAKASLGRGKEYVKKTYGIDEETYSNIKKEVEDSQFWYIEEDKNGKQKIKVDLLLYKTFLESSGFKKHYPHGADEPNFVKVVSNKVEDTSIIKIKDYVLDYILNTKKKADVWSYFASYSALFSESILSMLDTIELKTLKDEKDKCFFAFENGILEVTKQGSKLLDYIDIDVFVWQEHIIKRNFTPSKNNDNEYKTFISNVTRQEPLSFECSIGYLLSTYKNKMNNKAIILNDEVISNNPEGGTGKGVFIQGIRQLRSAAILDGKTFSDQKSFPYQTVGQDTNILVFDDVKKNFDFESKFSLITEGLTLERKGKDAIKLDVEDSPKLIITTNYAIKGSGNSHARRRHELELAQFYTGNNTPYDEFGRQLFDDWGDEDYNRFDNYMIGCVKKYLKHGLIEQTNAVNIETRRFIADTNEDFYSYMSEIFFGYGERLGKKQEFEKLKSEYPDFQARWFTQNRFTIWIKSYAKFKGLEYNDGISNGLQWFTIGKESDEVRVDLEENDNEMPF